MEEEAPRQSLLDVVIEEYNQEKSSRTSRLLLSGIIDPDRCPVTAIQKWHEDFFDKLDKEHKITGVLFVLSNTCILHLIEAPTPVLLALLRALTGRPLLTHQSSSLIHDPINNNVFAPTVISPSTTSPSSTSVTSTTLPVLKSTKILSFSEEIPREYPLWCYRSIRVPSEEFQSPTKDYLKIVFETLKNLLELARELSNFTQHEKVVDYIMNNSGRQLLNRLPSVERIQAYQDVDDLCSIQDFLDIYDTPVDFTLENEKVWPHEPFLKY